MNADMARTKEYYATIADTELCDCSYCCNYRMQIKSVYPDVAEYLESFGVDIQKPFETSPLEPDENGMLEYCGCQYIIFGNCEPEYEHSIGSVKFRVATSYPSTGIELEHFVIEFCPIRLRSVTV